LTPQSLADAAGLPAALCMRDWHASCLVVGEMDRRPKRVHTQNHCARILGSLTRMGALADSERQR